MGAVKILLICVALDQADKAFMTVMRRSKPNEVRRMGCAIHPYGS
jgi:hypothetical protein